MEGWKSGRVEEWKAGRMEDRKTGRMEEWKNGRLDTITPISMPAPVPRSSTLPPFHPSTHPSRSEPARPAQDPLAVIPLRPANVEVRRDPAGCLHLRVYLRVDGWRAHIGRWLRYDFYRTVVLDREGTRFYDLVDGAGTLRAIAGALAVPLGRGVSESEQAVILFTRDLMRRGFLDLKVALPQPSTPRPIHFSTHHE